MDMRCFGYTSLLAFGLAITLHADVRLQDFAYPFPTRIHAFKNQGQTLEMVYMDVAPEGRAPAGTVVLLHGKNFAAAYWETTAKALSASGYRVLIPDQIGFGKSSKPENYHYTFHQLATNTMQLLETEGVSSAHVLGHSMGGMLATRFALMYPDFTDSLTLLNPIGLEDWKAKGVPYAGVDQWFANERGQTPEKIRNYMRQNYYDGEWEPEYDQWVEVLARFIESPGYDRMAWNQALTYDMIFTQPVVYEFSRVEVSTLLIIGQRDTTALGKDLVDEETRAQLGRYPELGRQAHSAIPDSTLIELDDIGHMPHIEDFERFIEPLQAFLKKQQDK